MRYHFCNGEDKVIALLVGNDQTVEVVVIPQRIDHNVKFSSVVDRTLAEVLDLLEAD